jgi:L-asparaginase
MINPAYITINTAFPAAAGARIMIVYTGGTLGMTYNADGALVPFDFAHIMAHLPALKSLALNLTVVSFEKPIDSSNIEPVHWQAVARLLYQNREAYEGFVVLHGTDTMAYTASALSFMLPNFGRPVVFTGAQLPISHPRSDARENLLTALEIAAARRDNRPCVPEVCIYFGSQLLRANRTKKAESMHFDAFQSDNYPPLAKAGVQITYNTAAIAPITGQPPRLLDRFSNQIIVIKLFPGQPVETIHHALAWPGLKAAVLETYGSGNAPTGPGFLDAIRQALGRGVIITNVSQCPGGMVVQGRYETSRRLLELGVLSGGDITTEAAVTKLMVLLGNFPENEVGRRFVENTAGEITPQ